MTVTILLLLKTSRARGSNPLVKTMNDTTLLGIGLGIGRAADHLAVHVVEIVGDRLGIVDVPVVDGRVSINIP